MAHTKPNRSLIQSIDDDGNDPAVWSHSARSLLDSASVLKKHREEALRTFHSMVRIKTAVSFPNTNYVDIERMLVGFAFENHFRALEVAEGKIDLYKDGVMQKRYKRKKPHDLIEHAIAAEFPLSSNEQDFLGQLTRLMTAYGRYPLALNETTHAGRLVSWKPRAYAKTCEELLSRINHELGKRISRRKSSKL